CRGCRDRPVHWGRARADRIRNGGGNGRGVARPGELGMPGGGSTPPARPRYTHTESAMRNPRGRIVLPTRPIPIGRALANAAQGSGEVTDRVRKSINRDRLPKADRLAAEEYARRARLPKDKQLDIELAEARARAAAL